MKMSLQQRLADVHARRSKELRVRTRLKQFTCKFVDDLPSEIAAVWSVMTDEVFFERWSGMSVFEDAFEGAVNPSEDYVCIDEKLRKSYPVLTEFLTATPTLGGKKRRVATMNVVYEDGQCKVGLRERDKDLSLWVSGTGLGEALQALEDALNDRPVKWRRVSSDYSSRGRKGS